MDKYVKRGLSAYVIFLKNKIASSIMMLFSGVMMFIGGLQGRGNDTKSLPLLITALGAGLSFWAFFRLGYVKSNFDNAKASREIKAEQRKMILFQAGESLLYVIIAGAGIFLLMNEGFTNKVLNLMAGFFTTLNGVFGAISAVKNRDNKDFRWKFMLVITALEFILGPYFIFGSDSIDITGYIIMGALTSVAGLIEVISAFTRENIRGTINDGKEIVHIIKDDKKEEDKDIEETEK